MRKGTVGLFLSCIVVLSCVGCSSSKIESTVGNTVDENEQHEYYEPASFYGIDFSDVEFSDEALASSGQNFYIDDNLLILEETTYQDFVDMGIEVPDECAEFDSGTIDAGDSFAITVHTYIADHYYFASAAAYEPDIVTLSFRNETEESISRYDCVFSGICGYYYGDVGFNRCSFEFNSDISKSDLTDNELYLYEDEIEGKNVKVRYEFHFDHDWENVRYILFVSSSTIPDKPSYDYSSIEVPFDSTSLDYFNQPFYIYGDKFICGTSTLQDFIDAGYLEDNYSDEIIKPGDYVYANIMKTGLNYVELNFANNTDTDLSAYDCILSYVYLNVEDGGNTTVFSLGFPCDITSDMLSDAATKGSDTYVYGQQMSYDKYLTSGYYFYFDEENNLSGVALIWHPEQSVEEITSEYYYEEAEYIDNWVFNSDSIDFQNMVVYYKGNKIVLGETTLNEFMALGVECTEDIDTTYIVGKHLVGTYKFKLSGTKTMTVQATNFTSDDLEFGNCVISGISISFDETDNIMQRQSYNALSFDFPMNITEEQVAEVEYDKDRVYLELYEDEEYTSYDFAYLVKDQTWTRDYIFHFDLNGNLISISLSWWPEDL